MTSLAKGIQLLTVVIIATILAHRLAVDLMSLLVKEKQCRDHLVTLNCLAVFLR